MVRYERTESALWETGGAILIENGEAVLIDPGITPAENEAIADRVRQHRAEVRAILITHAHWDHLTGIGYHPAATACMSPLARQALEDGELMERFASQAELHGFSFPAAPRCDRVLDPGQAAIAGPFIVETIPLPGHTADGLGFRVRTAGVLAVGDYLSTYEFPFVYHSTAAYRASLTFLLDLLEDDPPDAILSGHGRELKATEARRVAGEDLQYLHALRRAVSDSLAAGAGSASAIAAGARVEPPRAPGGGDARREENARHQLTELRP